MAVRRDRYLLYQGETDYQAALSLLDLFGGRLRPVTEVDGHNVLGRLMKRGQFAEFVEEMLG